MLDLDSPHWGALTHAHGSAADVPALLRRVGAELAAAEDEGAGGAAVEDHGGGLPGDDADDSAALSAALKDPLAAAWFELASALCPGSDVYPAAYAAVPHLVALAADQSAVMRGQVLHLVARVEALRHRDGAPPVPADLGPAYRAALSRVPHLVAARAGERWDQTTAQTLAGVLLVAKGHPRLGMAVLALDEEVECPRCATTFPPDGWDLGAAGG